MSSGEYDLLRDQAGGARAGRRCACGRIASAELAVCCVACKRGGQVQHSHWCEARQQGRLPIDNPGAAAQQPLRLLHGSLGG